MVFELFNIDSLTDNSLGAIFQGYIVSISRHCYIQNIFMNLYCLIMLKSVVNFINFPYSVSEINVLKHRRDILWCKRGRLVVLVLR